MSASKTRKVDNENRVFHDEWTELYAFTLPARSTQPVCLLCHQHIAVVKSSNIKRHYDKHRTSFERDYPLKSAVRSQHLLDLRARYHRSQRIMTNAFTGQQRALECSLRVAWVLGQNKKPFADCAVVKKCALEIVKTLTDGKQQEKLCKKVAEIPMSATTATRRCEVLTEDVLQQLDEAVRSVPVGLAVDESTDVTDNAQLLVYVRFFNKEKKVFCEDLLGVAPLKTSTKGEDIYKAIKEMLTERGIDMKLVVSITTDGAPSMVGRERGAVARMKEDHGELISYHCIIHQTVLCALLSYEYKEVMDVMMRMINFLRESSSLQHRVLREYLHELRSNKATRFSCFLEDDEKMDIVAFLVDITSHLNKLNLKLQGKDNSICDLMMAVSAFQRKLEVFREDLQGECAHFPSVQQQVQGQRDLSAFVDFVDRLTENFSQRFDIFTLGQQLTLFIQDPFLITDVRGFSKEVTQLFKWAEAGPLQMELVDLQADMALKEQFGGSESATFWMEMVPGKGFTGLSKIALYTLTMFGSTYSCEAAFSTMNIVKDKYRNRLTNDHLHMCSRMALTSFEPRFKKLAGKDGARFSRAPLSE
ncbi:PREDICTED: SCAN domain-containing protein 3-like [Xyrichtys novacula]|uniref:PREDICTED: SCAN domain-containing protein 3-like n=1 Tax=Xyrichtys novacula TaxID=13765 RepID=A0AAV1GQF7_XYRNO|nr:PREDICTED: SCAN domain-containing protein 3-like [Xyrichtys novacula]